MYPQVAQAPLGTTNITLRNSVIVRVCIKSHWYTERNTEKKRREENTENLKLARNALKREMQTATSSSIILKLPTCKVQGADAEK